MLFKDTIFLVFLNSLLVVSAIQEASDIDLEKERRDAGIQLNISSSPPSCVFDRVALHWYVPYDSFLKQHCSDPASGPQVCVYKRDSSRCMSYYPLCTKPVIELMAKEAILYRKPEPRQVVWCKLDQDLCSEPSVSNAIATGFFGELDDKSDTTLTITFNQATNTPNITTKVGVDNVFIFSKKLEPIIAEYG